VGSSPYLPEISQWCDGIAKYLSLELGDAAWSMRMGKLGDAKQILDQALVEASRSLQLSGGLPRPLMQQLVDRGITLSRALDRTMGNSKPELLAKVNFLSGFVQLVIDESDTDQSYYVPYYYSYHRCTGGCPAEFDMAGFEQQMIQYAHDLLQFTYDQLTITTEDGGIYPAGDPRAFLTVAELVTAYAAQDLSSTLSAYVNSCTIMDLQSLSNRIASQYLGGYPTYPIAVAQVRGEMEEAAAAISDGSCMQR
jgi:hypothetical protein